MYKKNNIVKEVDVAATVAAAISTEVMRIEALTAAQVADVVGGAINVPTASGAIGSIIKDIGKSVTDGLVAKPTPKDIASDMFGSSDL